MSLLGLVLALAAASPAASQFAPPVAPQSVVLPASSAAAFSHLCSRPGIPAFESSWEPSDAVVRALEHRLGDLEKLEATGCCVVGAHVDRPDRFYRQYVGVVIGGKRFVYINAYPRSWEFGLRSEPETRTCDGGTSFWGVLYDVATGAFSGLAFNGVG